MRLIGFAMHLVEADACGGSDLSGRRKDAFSALLHVLLVFRAGVLELVDREREDVKGLCDCQKGHLRADRAGKMDAVLDRTVRQLRPVCGDEDVMVHDLLITPPQSQSPSGKGLSGRDGGDSKGC